MCELLRSGNQNAETAGDDVGHRLYPAPCATPERGGLYGLLAVVVVLGLINAFVRAFPLFNLVKLPDFGLGALKHDSNSWHDLAANIMAAIVGLHVAAALYHHLVLRDRTLAAMLPDRRVSLSEAQCM